MFQIPDLKDLFSPLFGQTTTEYYEDDELDPPVLYLLSELNNAGTLVPIASCLDDPVILTDGISFLAGEQWSNLEWVDTSYLPDPSADVIFRWEGYLQTGTETEPNQLLCFTITELPLIDANDSAETYYDDDPEEL